MNRQPSRPTATRRQDEPTLRDHEPAMMTSQAMVRHIEHWPIEKLVPYARNARTHSEAQVAQIAASIREFGFNNPIRVDIGAGVIAGQGRLLAALQLQLTEVPVIVLDHLSETQKRAYILVDNKLAENAGWDEELVRCELAALEEADFHLEVIGLDDDELARLLADQEAPGLTDEDAIPEISESPIHACGLVGGVCPPACTPAGIASNLLWDWRAGRRSQDSRARSALVTKLPNEKARRRPEPGGPRTKVTSDATS